MPLLDGYESTKCIRNYYKSQNINQPLIVACTGHAEEEFIRKAWTSYIDEVVPKPIDAVVLKTIIQEIIQF